MVPQYSPPATMGRHEGVYTASPHVQPPCFTKLEFTTYDGTVDPLNWLNQCDQFFGGSGPWRPTARGSSRTTSMAPHRRG
jgi:hypothetical protein